MLSRKKEKRKVLQEDRDCNRIFIFLCVHRVMSGIKIKYNFIELRRARDKRLHEFVF